MGFPYHCQSHRNGPLQKCPPGGIDNSFALPHATTMLTRLVCSALCLVAPLAFAQGTVALRNLTHPYMSIQVNDYVTVTITGAAPNSAVTVIHNGGAPFFFGNTDANGYWQLVAHETSEYIGDHEQIWRVNGVPLTVVNPDPNYFGYAPRLPAFRVHDLLPSGTNDPTFTPASAIVNCSGPNSQVKWVKQPIRVRAFDYIAATQTAVNRWNSIQTRLPFLYVSDSLNYDVHVDAITPLASNVLGNTYVYSNTCNTACFNRINECNQTCFSSTTEFGAWIQLNPTAINFYAQALGHPTSTIAEGVATHELGHTLPLDHSLTIHGICDEVHSALYPVASGMFSCGVTSPTTVDRNVLHSYYIASPTYCGAGSWCYADRMCQ